MPAVGMADDTQIAEFVKSRLQEEQQLGHLKGFNVDMRVDRGTVWFEGFVSNREQQMTILRTAQKAGHLGVVQVVNDIEVRPSQAATSPYRPAGYQQPQHQAEAAPVAYTRPAPQEPIYSDSPVESYPAYSNASYGGGSPLPFASCSDCAGSAQPSCGESYPAAPSYGAPSYGAASASAPPAPAPIASYGPGAPGPGAGGPSGPANLPGYAWPSYAAAPNYGAVSYPRQHSASAWPYIGPFYPYPQVPLGWRKVTLEWDDGWWQLDFNDK